jgi:hypothetical protein
MIKELESSNKSKREVEDKCNEIIDSLAGFNLSAKHEVVSNLYHGFISSCRKSGIEFIETEDEVRS